MKNLSAFLKKYNCVWVRINAGGAFTLRIEGNYDGNEYPQETFPLCQIVYVEDFPALMNTFTDYSEGRSSRLYAHFRMELGSELHWAYLCCEKTEEKGVYNGVLLDVYEYLECIPNDGVIAEFESRQKLKISDLNSNGASLEEVCGKDYLLKAQLPFKKTGTATAIYDDKGRLICGFPENMDVEKAGFPFVKKAPIRFNYKLGGWWYVGAETEVSADYAQTVLETLADNLSRIAHSFILLYNETQNSRAVNRQLGTNVEQQLMINNIYSVTMEEPNTERALQRVLEMTSEYLHVDRIAAYLPEGDEHTPQLICHYETDSGKQSTLDEFIGEKYDKVVSALGITDNYFSQGTEKYATTMSAYAVSRISAGKKGIGLLFYQIFEGERHWDYSDRRIIRNVSQIISGLILRREMDEELEDKNRQLTHLAFFDSMLGIRNRSKLDLDVDAALKSGGSGIVIAVQILNTRALNEVFGQNYTDRLLRMVSEFLSLPEIAGDSVYRYSGSILMLLLPEETNEGAQKLAQDVLSRFSEPFIIDGVEQYAETAVGVASYNPSVARIEDLYRAAALSLYRANEYGKNSLAFFSREFYSPASSAYRLEQELRRCIADNMHNFTLEFQPVYRKNEIHHYETLLRWRSEKEGRVSPRVFMKLMEKVGLDSAIDLWVIPGACGFCRRMREETGENVRVSVNLTTREMQSGVIPGTIQNALNEAGLSPDALIAEVPEEAHIHAANETAATLGRLKKMGVSTCVDSFGNEYLPLHLLKYSYIDMIKLSASFVTNSGDSFDEQLVRTVVSLSESRGVSVIVKNIQYEAQLVAAKRYGISCWQGELLTPPVSEREILQQLMEERAEKAEMEIEA